MECAGNQSPAKTVDVVLDHQTTFPTPYENDWLHWGFGCIVTQKGNIVLVNRTERCLQVYNSQGKPLAEMKVVNEPQDLTEISDNLIAVSYGNSAYFEIADISNYRYKPVKVLETRGKTCWGISSDDNTIAVKVSAFSKTTFQLHDSVTYETKQLVSVDETGIYAICLRDSKIYCSNAKMDCVSCYDLQGSKLWTYENEILESSSGITVDHYGNVFVVGTKSKSLIMITENGKRHNVVKINNSSPISVSFDKYRNNLLIRGLAESNIYNIKKTD